MSFRQHRETLRLIEEWAEAEPAYFAPPHDVQDPDKLATLVADMREHGWRGAPIVVCGDQAMTGSHRYWAVQELAGDDIDIIIPRIDIEKVFSLCDLDWAEWRDQHFDDLDAMRTADEALPREVVDYLGLDMH